MRPWLMTVSLLVATLPIEARSAQRADAKLLTPLFSCLEHSGDAERLACLDREARLLRKTEQAHGVLLMDKKEAVALQETTKRNEERNRAEQIRSEAAMFKPVDGLLAAVRQGRQGWVFDVKDEGSWAQVDSVDLGRTPRSGERVRIRRGPVGGFLLNVGTGPAIRVRRVS